MRIEKFVFGPVGTNCYIVINEMTSECFAVDMADCPQEFVKHIKRCRTLRKSAAFDAWSL